MAFECEMHSHTVNSDGNDTPFELIKNAKSEGVRVLVVCDHDVKPPYLIETDDGQEDFVEFALKNGIAALRGCEFSCETNIEDVHIVALGCDFNTPELEKIMDEVEKSKTDAYVELIERLNECGMPMTVEEVLTAEPPIELKNLQKKRIFDMMARKGYAPTWKEAKLMVRDDKRLSVKRRKPDAVRVIREIIAAGGIATLAHPYLIDPIVNYEGKEMTRTEFIDILIDAGIRGIEVRYPYDKTSSKDKRPNEEIWADIEKAYGGRLILSGGSDYHNDAKKGTANPRRLGECGITLDHFLSTPYAQLLTEEQRKLLCK